MVEGSFRVSKGEAIGFFCFRFRLILGSMAAKVFWVAI